MNTTIDFSEIFSNLENGYYSVDKVNVSLWPEDMIIDENLSLEENLQIVKLHNETCLKKAAKYKKEIVTVGKQLRLDVVCAIINGYNFNREMAMYIEKWVYAETKKQSRAEYVEFAEIISDMIIGLPNKNQY